MELPWVRYVKLCDGRVFVGLTIIGSVCLTGCQDGPDVGLANRCQSPVEVHVDGSPDEPTASEQFEWLTVEPGHTTLYGPVAKNSSVFVWIRATDATGQPDPIEFDPKTLTSVGKIDALVIVEGALCPSEG